jgi:hypothetical protein
MMWGRELLLQLRDPFGISGTARHRPATRYEFRDHGLAEASAATGDEDEFFGSHGYSWGILSMDALKFGKEKRAQAFAKSRIRLYPNTTSSL